MGQTNSRSKHNGYPLPHPGNLHPGPFYPPAPYSAYPTYHAPNQHLVVPYPIFAQPSTRRKRRRPSASGTTQPYMGQAASTSNRPVMPISVPTITESRTVAQPDNLFTPLTNGGDRLANFPAEPQIPVHPRGRAQTPYHAPVPPPESEEEEEDEPPPQVVIPSVAGSLHPPSASQHRRRHSEPLHRQNLPPAPPVNPPGPSAFDRPLWSPSGNPLPEPPRDLFDSEAYKAVLNIPRGTDLFTALYGYQRGQVQQPGQDLTSTTFDSNPQRTRTGLFGRKNSKGGGLFRTLTGTRGRRQDSSQFQPQDVARDRVRAGDVRLVPFPVPVERRNNETQPSQGAFRHVPPSEDRYVPATLPSTGANTTGTEAVIPPPPVLDGQTGGDPPFPVMPGPSAGGGPSQTNAPFPVMTAPPRAPSAVSQHPIFPPEPPVQYVYHPPLTFTQFSPAYQGFFPHSPHRVLYNNAIFPTATHLHEALKYLPGHPTIATQIRLCVNLNDVYPLSAANMAFVRPDWGSIFLEEMEKVLELKFRQHAELRNLLIEGVEGQKGREIIYQDENDTFWGDGGGDGRGANELGKILAKVRDKLIEDRDRG
ncbi:hypothetical protein J3R30DRAFT_3701916 [Lentinula aciculospora]|uniref:NADAR domain-containing protein n=1 Tax=Lentinula aciculospora TaxID=153920 RepID=A0A9W9DNN7_9AGAR|nr:hypothetical protein J3R30DRAFT_3701916 [Lentinula aciculospora]